MINKKNLHFSFNFHCSFHRYKYLNWSARHGELFLLFLCLRRSVECKVINNRGWIAWKNETCRKQTFLTAQITNLFRLKGKILLFMFLKVGRLLAPANLPLDSSGMAVKFTVRRPKLEGLHEVRLAQPSTNSVFSCLGGDIVKNIKSLKSDKKWWSIILLWWNWTTLILWEKKWNHNT